MTSRATQAIVAGAIVSCIGIVLAAAGNPTAGGAIVLTGWLAFIAGIHRFGRAG